MGKISYEEKAVLIVFILTALAWVFRSFIQIFIPIIDDTIIATIAAITLFMISAKSSNRRLLLWSEAVKLPWGIILLFGGGMALAKGFTDTGLADWIAAQFSYLKGMELFFSNKTNCSGCHSGFNFTNYNFENIPYLRSLYRPLGQSGCSRSQHGQRSI